jgi:hypothetical protein
VSLLAAAPSKLGLTPAAAAVSAGARARAANAAAAGHAGYKGVPKRARASAESQVFSNALVKMA